MPKQQAWPSVVDVLTGQDKAARNTEEGRLASVDVEVRTNLERLLNTRLPPGGLPLGLTEVSNSIQNAGVMDFARYGFDSYRQRRALCASIRKVIESSEPRLKEIAVDDLNEAENLSRQLSFRITGQLQLYPHPKRIVFESTMDRATTLFKVHD